MHSSRAPRARLPRLDSPASYPSLLHGAYQREVGDNLGCNSLACPQKNACARLWAPLGNEQYGFVVLGNKSVSQSNHAHRRDGIHEQRRCCPWFDGSFDALVVFRTLSMFIDVCSDQRRPRPASATNPRGVHLFCKPFSEPLNDRASFAKASLVPDGSRSFHAPTFAGMRRRRRRLAGTRRPRRTLASSLLGVHRGAHASPSHGPSSSTWRDGWWTSSFLGTFSFGWLVGKWMDHTLV